MQECFLTSQDHQIRGIKNLFLFNNSLPTPYPWLCFKVIPQISDELSLVVILARVGSGEQEVLEWLVREPLSMKLGEDLLKNGGGVRALGHL